MKSLRHAAVLLALTAVGCAAADGSNVSPEAEADTSQQRLAADNLYAKLRELEGVLPRPPASATIPMGSWVAGGNFSGVATTCTIVFSPIKHRQCTPPTRAIYGINVVLSFDVPDGVTLTANGKTATSSGGHVVLDVGDAGTIDWTLRSGTSSYADKLLVSRPEVGGVGAFTVAALPVTIVYEPPQNAARTNSASASFAQESTVVTTVSKGTSTTSTPVWVAGDAAKQIGVKMAHLLPYGAYASQVLAGVLSAWDNFSSPTTTTELNSDQTLSVKVASSQTITTAARGGPGHGDLVVFYKDARVAWGMDAGRVSLTLLDHGPLAMVTIDTLRADLAAANAGQTAPVTGLDAVTLSSLIKLDPMTSSRLIDAFFGVSLPTSRFTSDARLLVNGASYSQSLSHTITASDQSSKMSVTTTVKDANSGWLSLIGIGEPVDDKVTTKVSFGSSRTTSTSNTKTATLNLNAASNESYSVDVFYDNIFGTFLSRVPTPPPPVVIGGAVFRASP
ncbi:hypothetical protein BH11MYX4_BH11MYX4_19720 [soil metagenome]